MENIIVFIDACYKSIMRYLWRKGLGRPLYVMGCAGVAGGLKVQLVCRVPPYGVILTQPNRINCAVVIKSFSEVVGRHGFKQWQFRRALTSPLKTNNQSCAPFVRRCNNQAFPVAGRLILITSSQHHWPPIKTSHPYWSAIKDDREAPLPCTGPLSTATNLHWSTVIWAVYVWERTLHSTPSGLDGMEGFWLETEDIDLLKGQRPLSAVSTLVLLNQGSSCIFKQLNQGLLSWRTVHFRVSLVFSSLSFRS